MWGDPSSYGACVWWIRIGGSHEFVKSRRWSCFDSHRENSAGFFLVIPVPIARSLWRRRRIGQGEGARGVQRRWKESKGDQERTGHLTTKNATCSPRGLSLEMSRAISTTVPKQFQVNSLSTLFYRPNSRLIVLLSLPVLFSPRISKFPLNITFALRFVIGWTVDHPIRRKIRGRVIFMIQ